jgi:hypothetical protein
LDLAIHGLAGEPGLVEIAHLNVGNVIVSADTAVTGLTVFAPFPGPHSGTVYNFIYEQSFHVSAIAHGGCSECGDSQFPFRGSARVISPFYVYDLNMNLRETIISPLDAQAAPEPKPGSLALHLGVILAVDGLDLGGGDGGNGDAPRAACGAVLDGHRLDAENFSDERREYGRMPASLAAETDLWAR